MPTATFFVTTPRSGTQWLAWALSTAFSDRIVVEHEPVGHKYCPRKMLRNPDGMAEIARLPEIAGHFSNIERILDSGRSYVEVGFPACAAAPLLHERFADRLRLVQMTRHPVKVAASLTTLSWYLPDKKSWWDKVAFSPQDPGVVLKSYAARWSGMSRFEKCLYHWFETHRYGQDIETDFPETQFRRVQFEKLIANPSELGDLFGFISPLEFNLTDEIMKTTVDNFRKKTTQPINFEDAHLHPEIMGLSRAMGYQIDEVNIRNLSGRYQESWLRAHLRSLKSMVRRTVRP